MNKSITLQNHNYDDIEIGKTVAFSQFISADMVDRFADLTGDHNPLHVNEEYASSTEFGGRITHGMLMGSFFSTLVGMLCPGKKCLYLSQDLRFRNPLPVDSEVVVSAVVKNKIDALMLIELDTEIRDQNDNIIVSGVARVKVRDD